MASYLKKLKYYSNVECFLGCPSAITLAVNSVLTDWHDWAQELWHSRSIAMTLTALLEEGMRKELTSRWAHGGVPL